MNGLTTAWNPSRLAEARRAKGFSQEALAARLTKILGREAQPVRVRNVVRWEKPRGSSGAHAPHADFIAAIAKATDREVGFFLENTDDDEEAEPVASFEGAIAHFNAAAAAAGRRAALEMLREYGVEVGA